MTGKELWEWVNESTGVMRIAKVFVISPWLALCFAGMLVLAVLFVPLVSLAWIADYSARIVARLYGSRFLP